MDNVTKIARVIWVQSWTEIELGWGQRPDGMSIYTSKEAADIHAKESNDKRIKEKWEEFSVPDWSSAKRVYVEPLSELEQMINSLNENSMESLLNGGLWVSKDFEKALKMHFKNV